MYTAKLQNQYGNVLELTNNPDYTIKSIEGLSPVSANINLSSLGVNDGSMFNSSRKNERNIVITVAPEGDVEKSRLQLYHFAPTKKPVRFYFKNSSRDVYIDGYVETHEVNLFENRQECQISILCPQPFFRAVEEDASEFETIEPTFEFSFFTDQNDPIEFSDITINRETVVKNSGDSETGVKIELRAFGTVVNPVVYNQDTGELFRLNTTMQRSDVIRITTGIGEKSVKRIRDTVETNIMNTIQIDSAWFSIPNGEFLFTFDADSGYEYLAISITTSNKFEGV